MALFPEGPLVDCENPLYCPQVSAQQYMSSIRLFQASVTDVSKFPYFNRLCNAFTDDNLYDSPQSFLLQLTRRMEIIPVHQTPIIDKSGDINRMQDIDNNSELRVTTRSGIKREPGESSFDSINAMLKKPPKRVKRSSSHPDVSFVLSDNADHLGFSDKLAQLSSSDMNIGQVYSVVPAEELFWPEIKQEDAGSTGFIKSGDDSGSDLAKSSKDHPHAPEAETPNSISVLLTCLSKLLPGLRLDGQFDPLTTKYQDIVDLLGIKGHLNPQTLRLFRNAQVYSLNLSESMADADGLNLLRNDTLKVLRDPSGFPSLRSIVLSDIPLHDDDLACLSDLFTLESLSLDDTKISNIGVMHLITLRHNLAHLKLSWNDRITDDAIPTLCNFLSLEFICMKGTTITMKGLRKLASSVGNRGQKISIISPSECEEYIYNRHNEYEVNIAHPYVHDPVACRTLSDAALTENLATHAKRNPRINTEGTRGELEKRLRKLLERREMDMIVHGFMLQGFV